MTKTRVGIFGYGNLGRGVELACRQNDDMELVALFTRRDPATVKPLTEGVPVFAADEMASHRDNIDVLVLCGGSANDLPEQTPACANLFNVVDSFDTHANIPAHFAKVDAAAQESGNVAVISAGWDPGMFSIARLYASSVLPEGEDYTFWAAASRRVTATPFVASRAWPMRASTPCPSPRRSKPCATARSRS